ncbi:pyridoxal phosphate-dependent aminotransferase [Maridesulfovibrio bastinii]|uniref:pyridoxal phosphate-dependent aminotransferase n=1 Tax=Maridesulfovibrio bastinii TaxID=47157 RepID=UPI00041F7DEE|nr:histidinol-phosphate transaminase [Maridesulfovibrio bastinii]
MTTQSNIHHDEDSLQPFVEQSLDRLDQIEKDLMRLEKTEYLDPESITRIYSTILAIKESANLNAVDNITKVAGGIAEVMDKLFKKEIVLNSTSINILIDAFDNLTEIIGNASHSKSFDIEPLISPLHELASGSLPETAAPVEKETVKEEPVSTAEVKAEYSAPKTIKKSASASSFKKRYGITKEIDLYSNSNPIGVSKAVSLAMERMSTCCNAFEENNIDSLKFGLAKRHDVNENQIVIATASIEILDLLLRISVTPGRDHILSYSNGLPEYSSVAALCGVELLRLRRGRNFMPPLDQLVAQANDNTAAVLITNPDIPSGYGIAGEEIATMVNLLPDRTLLIVDERSVEFSWPEDDYTALHYLNKAPNLIVLRSFSWSFGLRGLRLGYGIMNSSLARKLEDSRLPIPISPVNVGAGLAALNHSEFYYSTIALIIKGRERMEKGLQDAGCTVYPGQSNFVMFSVPVAANTFYEEMLARGLHVRKLDEFGLPDLMTASIGNNSRNRTFLAAVNDILE